MAGEGNTSSSSSSACGQDASASNRDFDQISFVIAISLAIFAAISNNLGVNLQKLAWTKKQAGTATVARYRFIWVCGMAGVILASVFDFVALAFGPQSVIAPLGALTMVMNACVAPWMHGERLPRIVYLATLIIVAGCATAVATASHENVICNFSGIFSYFLSVQSVLYFIFITVLGCGIALFIRRAERVLQEFKYDSEEYQRIFKLHRMSYAFLAGLFGAQSIVFARALGMMFQATARGEGVFLAFVQTYGILLGLIVTIAIQITYLNKGLSRFESTYNVPVFTGAFIVGTAVAGGIVYEEFSGFKAHQAVLFPMGVIMCIFGVALLAKGGSALKDPSEADSVEPNEDDDVEGKGQTAINPTFDPTTPIPDSMTIPGPPKADGALPPPRFSSNSLRIRSGGFFPFSVEENSHRRTSSVSSAPRLRAQTNPELGAGHHNNNNHSTSIKLQRAGAASSLRPNWLLGIKIDEEEDYVREGSTPSY